MQTETGRAKYIFVFNNKIQKTIVDTALVREKNNNNKIQKQTKKQRRLLHNVIFWRDIIGGKQ